MFGISRPSRCDDMESDLALDCDLKRAAEPSRIEIVFDHRIAGQGNPLTGKRGIESQRRLAELQGSGNRQGVAAAGLLQEDRPKPVRIMQESVVNQVLRRPDRMVAGLERRAANRKEFEWIEQLRGQTGAKGRAALTHRDIHAVALEIRQTLGCHDPHVQFRVRIHEPTQPGDKPLGREGWRNADRQDGLARPKFIGCIDDELKRPLNGGEILPPVFRQRQTARQSVEKPDLQIAFQAADLLRDRALRDADLFGGKAEIEVAP